MYSKKKISFGNAEFRKLQFVFMGGILPAQNFYSQ